MMKLKKISLFFIIVIFVFFATGCSDESAKNGTTSSGTSKVTIVDEDFNASGSGTLKCVQAATASEGIEVDINYTIVYKRGNILSLRSSQKVVSSNQDNLDIYENAYKGIASNYKNLDNYDTSVVRDSNSVTYSAFINYEEVDLDKLIDIEGKEDNIIDGDKAKLSLWLDLAEQVGVTCEEA